MIIEGIKFKKKYRRKHEGGRQTGLNGLLTKEKRDLNGFSWFHESKLQ